MIDAQVEEAINDLMERIPKIKGLYSPSDPDTFNYLKGTRIHMWFGIKNIVDAMYQAERLGWLDKQVKPVVSSGKFIKKARQVKGGD